MITTFMKRLLSTTLCVAHRRRAADGSQTLVMGAANVPFPSVLTNSAGQWFFDAAAGKDEILKRRIRCNELAVIEVCAALADAQAKYISETRDSGSTNQYVLKSISDDGKQKGLYWEGQEGQPQSPVAPLLAVATNDGDRVKGDSREPLHGYNLRLLKRQGSQAQGGVTDYVVDAKMIGGFALVAYPAQYGNSGIMTFIINQDGVMFQKDLGEATTEIATAMSEFNPDTGWNAVTAKGVGVRQCDPVEASSIRIRITLNAWQIVRALQVAESGVLRRRRRTKSDGGIHA